jgi:hypothetical protein
MAEILSPKKSRTLLSVLDDSVSGVIWVTDVPLDQTPKHYEDIDYLLDGMLTKHITFYTKQEQAPDTSKALFFNETFGQKFSLAVLTKGEKLKSNIEEFLNLLQKAQETKVVIISHDNQAVDKGILKKFPHISFEYFLPEKL